MNLFVRAANIHLRRNFGIMIAFFTLLIGLTHPVFTIQAQSSDNRSLHWARWDVLIDNIDTTSNAFQVTETYDLVADQGPFHGGFRNIPLDRITSIDNIQVYDNGTKLQMVQTATCPTSQPGIACYTINTSASVQGHLKLQELITYVFGTTLNTGAARTIKLIYTVHGALRSYRGGDQLYWSAIATDRPFDVRASRVTVQMPSGVTPQIVTSYPSSWIKGDDGRGGLTFDSPEDLGLSDGVEVRIQYPHNPIMQPPLWQVTYDQNLNRNVTLTLNELVISGLIAIGISLFVVWRLS